MPRILIVDYEPDQRLLTRRVLERDGHEVTDAASGEAALQVARSWMPDLVVTDTMLPVMDGAELIRRLRGDPQTAGILIVAVNAETPLRAGCQADAVAGTTTSFQPVADAVAAVLRDSRGAG